MNNYVKRCIELVKGEDRLAGGVNGLSNTHDGHECMVEDFREMGGREWRGMGAGGGEPYVYLNF